MVIAKVSLLKPLKSRTAKLFLLKNTTVHGKRPIHIHEGSRLQYCTETEDCDLEVINLKVVKLVRMNYLPENIQEGIEINKFSENPNNNILEVFKFPITKELRDDITEKEYVGSKTRKNPTILDANIRVSDLIK